MEKVYIYIHPVAQTGETVTLYWGLTLFP